MRRLADFFNDLYLFDISAGLWINLSVRGYKPAPRALFGFASAGGKLYVFGGVQLSGEYLSRKPVLIQMFGFANDSWYVAGFSNDFYEMDVSNRSALKWRSIAIEFRTPGPRASLGLAALNGALYVFGGYQSTGRHAARLAEYT